jgi:hypothetical protein
MLSVIVLDVVYAKCLKYALYAECRYAEGRGAILKTLMNQSKTRKQDF